MTNNLVTKEKFESAVRKLTRNPRVIAALLKCFEAKDLMKRGEFNLSTRERNEFNTVADWVIKEGWLK